MEIDTPKIRERYQEKLLQWFDNELRDLPWRKTNDPYAIWISEIMLQQTQVKTVLPYFNRFVEKFPDVFTLAGADLHQVLKLWEGLGYYARARNLHKAANMIVEKYQGRFPTSIEQIKALPGIGPYTAAAISSISFGSALAVVDGNVERVLARLFTMPTKSPADQKKTKALAEQLLARKRPGDYNQAIMELGALVCKPRNPLCDTCPVAEFCLAFKYQKQDSYPVKRPKKHRPHHLIAVGVVWHQGKILIARRPESAMLGGLWEFPGGKVKDNESLEQTVQREIWEEMGIRVQVGAKITCIEHGYTHFSITLCAFHCEYLSGTVKALASSEWRWISPDAIENYAFPRANHKIFKALTQPK
jgi:A/G-specific adenine glycosylase